MLAAPMPTDQVRGVATLTALGMATRQLLANSHRWADASVFSRGVIDLAVLQPKGRMLASAFARAGLAYGDSITTDPLPATCLVALAPGHGRSAGLVGGGRSQ